MADLKQETKESDEEEERRIFYVASTRAREHLVLSGATDLEKLPEPRPLGEPMAWLWRAFCGSLEGGGPVGIHVDEYGGRHVKVRWERCTPDTLEELLPRRTASPRRPPRRRRRPRRRRPWSSAPCPRRARSPSAG